MNKEVKRIVAEKALREKCSEKKAYGELSLHSVKEYSHFGYSGIPVVCKVCGKTFSVTSNSGNARAIDLARYELPNGSRHSVIILRCECPHCREKGERGFGFAAYDGVSQSS